MWWSFRVQWTHWNRNGEALWPHRLSASYFRTVFKERWLTGPQCRNLPSPSLPPLAFPPSPIPRPPLTFLGFWLFCSLRTPVGSTSKRTETVGGLMSSSRGRSWSRFGYDHGKLWEGKKDSFLYQRVTLYYLGFTLTQSTAHWSSLNCLKKNPACSLHKTLWRSHVSVLHSGGGCGELIV